MSRVVPISSFIICLAAAGSARGHGFRIGIDGNNKLVLHSDDPTAGLGLIYKAPSLLGPPTSRSQDHPGYDAGAN